MKNQLQKQPLEILIVGKGGEGVVFMGELLGLAATLDGKFACQRSTYGASQRGEALYSEIIVSSMPIQYSFVESPRYFISMSQQGFEAYYHRLNNTHDPMLFIDSTYDYDLHGLEKNGKVIKIGARSRAIRDDLPVVGNIIMLSAFIRSTNLVTKQALKKALLKRISSAWYDQNLKALEIGFKLS